MSFNFDDDQDLIADPGLRSAGFDAGVAGFGGSAVLEIDLLRTLVAIASTGSFKQAAKAVFRTPSAVSMQMKRLEDLIGRSIFAKDGRGVVLTEEGQELLGYARRILILADEALYRFRCEPTEGVVRLGTPDDYAAAYLPPILARFARSHPQVQVEVTCMPSDIVLKLIDEGEVDIALVSVNGVAPVQRIVHRDRLVWAGLRGGVAYLKRPLPLALAQVSCPWRRNALAALDEAGIAYRVAYTSHHYVAQLAAVGADLAVAPLAMNLLVGDLVQIESPDLPPLGFSEIDLRQAPEATGPAVEALRQHIVEAFAQRNGSALMPRPGYGASDDLAWISPTMLLPPSRQSYS
ncbi:MAG: LysR substrate-binding domain-containing protein [Ancalomicrobiaceae bacterium]|nr:LysR substrate-binding domain-containing protein [Ancalomicrobiaceae bacterium]